MNKENKKENDKMKSKVTVKVYTYGIKYNIYGKIITTDTDVYTIECLPEQVMLTACSVALVPDLKRYDQVELRWQFQGKRFMYHYDKAYGKTCKTYQENTPHQWA